MNTYRYRGQTAGGARVSGVIRALDEYEAVTQLREKCTVITRLEEVKEKDGANLLTRPLGGRIREKELALLCSQFSIILSSGLPVVRCVEMVAAQSRNRRIARQLEKVAEEIGAGYSMAQSFENNMPGLPKTFIETVRAGEQSGSLEECFRRLYKYFDKSAKTRAKLASALTYPIMVMAVAIIVFIIIMVVAVPAFSDAFAELGTDLPGVTRGLMAASGFLTHWGWLVLLILAGAAILYTAYKQTERGKVTLAANALKRAPLRQLHTMNAAGQFATAMATMLAAGLPVPQALDVVGQVVDNYVFGLGIREVKQGVERGRGIAETMSRVEYFPPMLTEMVGVGERSGSLEETLDVIGAYFENETELLTGRLLSLLEPLITIVLAVVVVILLLAVYMPLFSMYGAL